MRSGGCRFVQAYLPKRKCSGVLHSSILMREKIDERLDSTSFQSGRPSWFPRPTDILQGFAGTLQRVDVRGGENSDKWGYSTCLSCRSLGLIEERYISQGFGTRFIEFGVTGFEKAN